MVMQKLEKIEDNITIRDSDMEAEMADAVAAIDDVKAACSSFEENVTKVFFRPNMQSSISSNALIFVFR